MWNVEGHAGRVGRRARTRIARAESQSAVRVSSASVFEICTLNSEGRLHLARPVEQWIDNGVESMCAQVVPLSMSIGVDAGLIPRAALPDPLDRFLVATARQLNATLLTADARILDYASKTGHVRVADARR